MKRTPAPQLSPTDLGFLPKFKDWYPEQVEAIDRVIFNRKRFIALGMPTGSGKSPVGVASALLHADVTRAIYLTSTKGLQDQLAADFTHLGMCDLRGAKNYPCLALEAGGPLASYRGGFRIVPGCDEGPCHAGVECPFAPTPAQRAPEPDERTPVPKCLYYGQVFQARRANLVATNYSMWFASTKYAQGLGAFDLLILDEAHEADKELEAVLTTELTNEDIRVRLHERRWPDCATLEDWKAWAQKRITPLRDRLNAMEQRSMTDRDDVQAFRKCSDLLGRLKTLSELTPEDWVLDASSGAYVRVSPLSVAAYAETELFQGIKHVVLMSATMTKKTTQLLGIKADDLDFWEAPHRFPVERRPVISINSNPRVFVTARMTEDDKFQWVRRIDRIIKTRSELGWKGIIHTVSYQRMRELYMASDFKDLMITHDAGDTKQAIEQFKAASGPKLLVSPSIVTGYDFPDDDCRYQIIGKIPMPDMRGAIMQARAEADKEYAFYVAMQKLVQACGRPVRGPKDWAETFIVDDTFLWFLKWHKKHAPRWFLEAVDYADINPEPLYVED